MGRRAGMMLGLAVIGSLGACDVPGDCRETSRNLVDQSSAPLGIGGTLADLRATVGGTRSGPLEWHESHLYVRGYPPASRSELTVTITPPSTAWDVENEPFDVGTNERLTCGDHVETELEIELRSSDGMLDASLLATVAFETPDAVTIRIDVTDQDLGALPWEPYVDDAELLLVLEYGNQPAPTGSLRFQRSGSDASGRDMGFSTELATWTLPTVVPERPRPE